MEIDLGSKDLVPFRCGRATEGHFVHAIVPEGTAAHEWKTEHLVNLPELVAALNLPHKRDELFLWVPKWLVPAIKLYMKDRRGPLEEFVRAVAEVAATR